MPDAPSARASSPPRDPAGAPPGLAILLVEDEVGIRRFLRAALASEGYRLFEASTAEEGLVEAATRQPDLVIVDLGLPDFDGLEVIRRLRQWTSVPIIVLSARWQEQDKVGALDAGADDYVSKPFGVGELLARIRVALRHWTGARGPGETTVAVGDLAVEVARHRVSVAGREVHLTPIEFKLVTILARSPGKVLTHRRLLEEVWGPGGPEKAGALRVHVAQLRRKLEADPVRPRYLLTEPGVGYRLAAE